VRVVCVRVYIYVYAYVYVYMCVYVCVCVRAWTEMREVKIFYMLLVFGVKSKVTDNPVHKYEY